MLEAKNVSCFYEGIRAVDSVSFNLSAGEKLAVLGPNGCGKTTLMRALAGIMPYEGEIKIKGFDMAKIKRKQAASLVGLMSQMTRADFGYSVYETVIMGRYAKKKSGIFSDFSKEDEEIAENAMRDTNIFDLKDKNVMNLSGGQLQRVFLAQIFTQNPSLILLDEPANHLDLKYQLEMVNLLKIWTQKGERSAVGVFHDINLALSFADSVLLMKEGKAVYKGSAKNFDLSLLSDIYGIDVRSWMRENLKRWE